MVLEKTLESPLDCKEIQPVHSKGDQSWVFFGRTDAKAEIPILWPPHEKSWLIGKDPDAGRDCGQEEKGTTEDEMAGWHHRLDGHEFKWTPVLTVKILMLNHPSIPKTIILTHVILLFTSNNLFMTFYQYLYMRHVYSFTYLKSLLAFGVNITLDS